MSTLGDNSYLITGKVCPPKLPMQKIASEDWNSLTPSLLESLFNEVAVQGRQTNNSNSLCALSFQASVWLSTDGLSASSVGGLPYFLCNFCDYHTDSKAKLLQHIVCRHVFKCKLCDFVSFSLYELVQHQLHKHLDAEEMQPALNSKMVLMNLSLLQRNLNIFSQCDSISYSSRSSDGRPGESEIANSSVINISKVHPTGHHNNDLPQPVSGQSEQTYVKYESPVTSSKDKTHNVGADIPENNDAFSKPDWSILNDANKTGSLSKRGYSHGEFAGCELSPKRFRKSCDENSKTSYDFLVQSQSHSSQMPHFLDDSDSYVTSSCSPHKTASPVLLEMGEEENDSLRKNQGEAQETYTTDQVLSFFMESSSSAVSRDLAKSGAMDNENSTSELGPLQTTSSLYNDFYSESVSKKADVHLSGTSQTLSGSSTSDRSVLTKALKDNSQEGEKVQHPELSVLLREKLQVQPEKETSQWSDGPLLESCSDILEVLQHRSHLLQLGNFASHKTSELSFSQAHGVRDKNSRRRQSYSQDVTSEDVENFLMFPRNSTDAVKMKECNALIVDSRNDGCDNYVNHNVSESDEARFSVNEKERYDLLRRLLLGTANGKNISETVTTKPQEKQAEVLVSQDVSDFNFTQTNEDNSRFLSHSPLVTRASDMSLRDLLTQGLETLHKSLFFECSYCNFRSSSKAESQKHNKACQFRIAQKKTKTTVELLTKPDCMTKNGSLSVKNESQDGDFSSEKFVASELLKGLSEHYSECLSCDVPVHGKAHELQSESQLYVCDKSHTLQSDSQISLHAKSRALKSLSQVYSCNKSSALKTDSQIYSCNKSPTLKSDNQADACDKSRSLKSDFKIIDICLSKENSSSGRKIHISNEIETDNSKYFKQKSGQKKEHVLDYYSEDFESLSNFCSDKPDVSNFKKEEENKLSVPVNKKHNLTIGEEYLCLDKHLLSEKTQQKSRYSYACVYCDFSTNNVTHMRQHLFANHPTNASYVEAWIPPTGKTLLYFCRGVESTCAFVSSDSSEIFEHIKLCYCGYLDNFMDSVGDTSPDCSQVLFCLGQASEFINTTAVVFYCLRCSYYAPDFQQVADHISDNHAGFVAGVLSVNRNFIEPRIRMVCLVCKAHINVKLWVFHPCRQHSESEFSRRAVADLNSRVPSATKLETILRLSGYVSSSSLESHCLASGSGGTVCSDQEDCKSRVKINWPGVISPEPVNSQTCASNGPCLLSKSFNENIRTEAVHIKQEIPDVTLQEVDHDDVTVHFVQQGQLETDNTSTGVVPFSDNESNKVSQKHRITNSPHTCSRKLTSGSSVLHTLLTATGGVELSQQSFSSVHKLLQSNLASEEKRSSKPVPVLPADFMTADLHSQYPCILEILKRQESALQETVHAESAPLSSTVEAPQHDESRDFVTRRPNSALLSALCHPHVLSQQIHNAATTCLPKLHLLLPNQASEKLSPPPTSSASTAEGQDTTGPFTNLLQLLCKSKKSDP